MKKFVRASAVLLIALMMMLLCAACSDSNNSGSLLSPTDNNKISIDGNYYLVKAVDPYGNDQSEQYKDAKMLISGTIGEFNRGNGSMMQMEIDYNDNTMTVNADGHIMEIPFTVDGDTITMKISGGTVVMQKKTYD